MSRLKGKPFEILAVSLDDDRDGLVRVIKQLDVPGTQTWESTGWDNNPVRTLYNVQSMPTWFLIDASGVIRGRDPLGKELLPAVEAILKSTGSEAKRN